MLHTQGMLYAAAILIVHAASNKVPGSRRRCEEQGVLQGEIRTLQETQEVLQGEVTALRDTVATLSALVSGMLPEDCSVAQARGSWSSVTQVCPPGLGPRKVRCDQKTAGGGWTVILARLPTHQQPQDRHDFNRSWHQYKEGFGDINGEFWIGNDVLHALTHDVPNQLRVTLSDWKGRSAVSTWDYFRVGSEQEQYKLSVGQYQPESTAGDALSHHNQRAFSTYDHDNDIDHFDHCAQRHGGGWWYFSCYVSHLTGTALPPNVTGHHGIVWRTWRETLGLKDVTMMIRPASLPTCPRKP
ncbi:ficolin-1 isoform X2 [Procambarus clarkii]|uniref:ficolin-1 isoform X2 n=1 Tax=Procambarus clarkii TaxID=6728 RepID=UPI001E676A17|nr:ficolin-1-like isoform X2 [Procambarus clarkii]